MKTPPVLLPLLLATLPAGHAHANKKKQPKKIPRPTGTGVLEFISLKGEDKDKGGGVCLDGSPAGYYYREGWGEGATKFLLFYEGGGWCKNGTCGFCVFLFYSGSAAGGWLRSST
jgi:hypothetical protein